MVSYAFARLAAAFCAFACLSSVVSTPLNVSSFEELDNQARDILARATPAAPHFVIYSDKYVSGTTGPPAASAVQV